MQPDARRRTATLVAVAVVLLALIVAIALRHPRSDTHDARSTTPLSSDDPAPLAVSRTAAPEFSASSPADATPPRTVAAPLDHTVRGDPALHDDVRARILAAWHDGIAAAHNSPGTASESDASAPGNLDANYIRSIIRDEFLPMARTCYDQQLERHAGTRGRVSLAFTILGDPHTGGIVDDVQLEDRDAGVWDETFRTCMQETMRAMVFRAPSGGGRVTVRYPFVLEPEARDE